MLGNKSFLQVKDMQKSGTEADISESKFQQIIEEKDQQIARLTKTIKKLKKKIKQKEQVANFPVNNDGNTAYFKVMIEREVSKYNQLKEVLMGVTERIRKLSQEINSQFSIFQSSASMENIVNMLENANVSGLRELRSISMSESEESDEESMEAEQAVDQFQVVIRGLMMKHGEIHKMLKQNNASHMQLREEYRSLEKELKLQRKSKDLLQSLLQKNETQKNQLMNQINSIVTKQQVQELRAKNKQQLIMSYFQLHYRIRDLQKEKQEYLKSSTRDKQKQVKLYQMLLNQVKNIKDKQRSRQSVA